MMPSPQGGSVSERPPNLFNPRRITSTAEIDSLFWHTDRADTILAIKGKWKLQESGFLCCPTHTGDSETMILGARWQQALSTKPLPPKLPRTRRRPRRLQKSP
jgi:hypothetical protein